MNGGTPLAARKSGLQGRPSTMVDSIPRVRNGAARSVLLSAAATAALLAVSLAAAQQPPAHPPAQPPPAPMAPASTPAQEALRTVLAKRLPGKTHVLPATMETTQWGWFNKAEPAVL